MQDDTARYWRQTLQDLQSAHERLSRAADSPLFFSKALQAVEQDPDPRFKFDLLVLLRPVFEDVWPSFKEDEAKNEVLEKLFTMVLDIYPMDRPLYALASLLATVISIDGLDAWEEPLGQLIAWMETDDETITRAGVRILSLLLQRVDEAGPRLAKTLLPRLFEQFAHDFSEDTRVRILSLAHQTIKGLAAQQSADDQTLKQGLQGTYQLWMSLFTSVLQSSLDKHIPVKREALKCLVVIFRDLSSYLSRSLPHLYPIWNFINRLLPLFGATILFDNPISAYRQGETPSFASRLRPQLQPFLSEEEQDLSPQEQLQTLLYQAVQFISTIVSTSALAGLVKLTMYQIVSLLAYFSINSRYAQSLVLGEEMGFLQHDGEEELGSSLRLRCLGVVNDLIERFGSLAIQTVLIVSEHLYFNFSAQKIDEYLRQMAKGLLQASRNVPDFDEHKLLELYRGCFMHNPDLRFVSMKREAAALLLGRFNDDIIVFQTKSQSFDVATMLWSLLKRLNSGRPCERGTSIWCLSRYVELIALKIRDMFSPALTALWQKVLKQPIPAIKTVSMKAIATLSRKMVKLKLQTEPIKQQLLDGAMRELAGIPADSPSVVSLQLECLQQFLRLCPWAKKLVEGQAQFIQSSFVFNYKESHIFSSVMGLLRLWDSGEGFRPIEEGWWFLILQCFNHFLQSSESFRGDPQQCQFISKCLTITELLVLKSANLDKRAAPCFKCLRDLIMVCQSNDIATKASVCVKAILRQESGLVQRCGLGVYLKQIIVRLLEVPADKSLEGSSLYVGNIIMLAFERVLGQADRNVLHMVVNKVFRSRTPSVIQSLVLVFAFLINKCGKEGPFQVDNGKLGELVSFLTSFSIDNRMGLKVLIDKWLLQQSLFRGRLTKFATYSALIKLFLLRDKTLDNLLVIGFNPSHTNITSVQAPLKILSSLIRCLDHLARGHGPVPQEQPVQQVEQEGRVQIDLQKFQDESGQEQVVRKGGLADLEGNGSTCYMSAMLQFFDDGEECDETTEEDLELLLGGGSQTDLAELIRAFFARLQSESPDYWKASLKGLLKEDIALLKRHMGLK